MNNIYKNNILRKRLTKKMTQEQIDQIELIGEKLVDEFWNKIDKEIK
jgi:hypothetical protein